MSDREYTFLGYVLGGLYGACAWYWYRQGRKAVVAEMAEPLITDAPCSGCDDKPESDSPADTSLTPGRE